MHWLPARWSRRHVRRNLVTAPIAIGASSGAEQIFAQAATAGGNGGDAPSTLYLARCRDLALERPGATWDRVYVMKHK